MATIGGDESKQHVGEAARQIVESLRTVVTGSPFVSLRTLFFLAVISAVASLAPFPWSTVGVVLCGVLAFELGRGKR